MFCLNLVKVITIVSSLIMNSSLGPRVSEQLQVVGESGMVAVVVVVWSTKVLLLHHIFSLFRCQIQNTLNYFD